MGDETGGTVDSDGAPLEPHDCDIERCPCPASRRFWTIDGYRTDLCDDHSTITDPDSGFVRYPTHGPRGRAMSETGARPLLRCQDYILTALRSAMTRRGEHYSGMIPDWIERERGAVVVAANQWAEANGWPARVTVADVERVEDQAVGHVDYATKLALYVAEIVVVAAHSGRSKS